VQTVHLGDYDHDIIYQTGHQPLGEATINLGSDPTLEVQLVTGGRQTHDTGSAFTTLQHTEIDWY
jgi:hypothetical protein